MLYRKLPTTLLLFGTTISLALAGGPGDLVLKDADHKKLGKEVAAYWDAKAEKKGIQAAFEDLSDAIAKSEKKLKGGDLIAAVDDWKAVFRYATLAGLDDRGIRKGRASTTTGEGPTGEAEYAYHVSKKYSAKKGPYPLLLIVPGDGGDPLAHLEAEWNDPALHEGMILMVVSMKTAEENWAGKDGVFQVMNAFAIAKDEFAVDYDRVFLAGHGKGFAAACATARWFPQLFAGIVGRGEIEAGDANNMRNLPSFLADAGEGGTAFESSVEELGYGNCTISADGSAAATWAWLSEQTREPYPQHISLVPMASFANGAHWLSVEGFDLEEGPSIDAQVDRDSNTITIEAKNIAFVEVKLNDLLVDMDVPVKVVVNGTLHEELVPRNKRTMIDLAYRQGDWARVFSNSVRYDVTAPSDG